MDEQIVQVKIHPAIGIARVGNSDKQPFIGPESPDQPPLPHDSYKDGTGKIIRQAARFRIYGYNKEGKVVRELKPGEAGVTEIKWSVHLANKKAAWYQFHIPLDIDEANALPDDKRRRRNFDIKQEQRKKLVNDPGRKTLLASKAETVTFDGKIMDKPVSLGSASAQADGRLVVVGGVGRSASFATPEKPISGVANNDTWYDDVSDGPITAEVTINGATKTALEAWVVVAPPHYAPGVKTVRTLYDLLYDVFVTEKTLPTVQKISYPDHIEPLLSRFCQLQWVNHGFATQFGWKGPHDFLHPDMRKRLNDPSDTSKELRRQVYVQMRDYARDGKSPVPWPWLYGDAMSSVPNSVRQHITLSPEQDRMLALWADGTFTPGPTRTGYPKVDEAPIAEQPGLLDRAALENCAADAFHPGCEVTWPMRHKTMYSEPFRILHRQPENPEHDYGDVLSLADALGKNGPLYQQGPGDLTRWMAAPWQCDTASCRSGYEVSAGLGPRYSPYLPTFWPAQMPNHVLKLSDFTTVNTKPAAGSDDSAREKAFENRAVWLRGLNGTDFNHQRRQMIDDWYKFGIVEMRKYTVGDGKFPTYFQVESEPGYPPAPDHANLVNIQVPEAGMPQLAAAADTWTGSVSAESVESMLVQQVVQQVMADTGRDEAEIAAGFLEKLAPLRDVR
ncbi:LodA/GoxA family CTQ-dependent oxidase [Streptomyces sp. NPDC048506]|uniref:LodA/GoxA family CTQ-dependent oxidase n=1 Tax=Streptomyces sp. NPDC048506 TaxID=3155028 RepID=UPI00342FB990